MQIEDYFDFLAPDDIRIKGHRLGIESILYEYVHRKQSAEQIAERFPTVSLEQVYATVLLYLRDQESIGRYLSDWLEFARKAREDQAARRDPFLDRMRQLRAERVAK
jgi:uncharacterized protein (DUF433 family)